MYYQDTAIVLARQDFREDDLLVSCYTQKHGKIILRAVGAKKIKSKLAGHIEPMNLVEINWVAGKGSDKLIGASLIDSHRQIKDDDRKVNYGFYFLEVVDKSTRVHHADKRIFEFLRNVLDKLSSVETRFIASQPRRDASASSEVLQIIKLCFDYKILFLLGHAPVYRRELKPDESQAVEKIINSPVNKVFKMNVPKSLYTKSKEFLEEVVEEEINSLKGLNSLKS